MVQAMGATIPPTPVLMRAVVQAAIRTGWLGKGNVATGERCSAWHGALSGGDVGKAGQDTYPSCCNAIVADGGFGGVEGVDGLCVPHGGEVRLESR